MSEHMGRDELPEWTFVDKLVLKRPHLYAPALAAFDLHLALRMEEHLKKHAKLREDDADPIEKIHLEFNKYVEEQYRYYEATSSDLKQDITAIPAELRLSHRNERSLMHYQGTGGKQDIRRDFQALQPPHFAHPNQNWKDWLSTTPIKEVSKPDDYSSPRSDIIRLLSANGRSAFGYASAQFFALYNRACSADPEERTLLMMDLFFLSRCDKHEPEMLKFLLGTLAFVASQPSQFSPVVIPAATQSSSLSLYESADTDPRIAVREKQFENILKIASKLDGTATTSTLATVSVPSEGVRSSPTISSRKTSIQIQVSLKYQLRQVNEMAEMALHRYFEQFITKTDSQQQHSAPFPLEGYRAASPLAQQLVEQLRAGHQMNPSVQMQQFKLRDLSQVRALQTELTGELAEFEKSLLKATADIEQLANRLPAEGAEERFLAAVKQAGKQVKRLTLQDPLLPAFMSQDARTIQEWNPHLTEGDLLDLLKKTAEILVIGRQLKLIEEALRLTDRLTSATMDEERNSLSEQLGQLMSAKTCYDIEEHPEYLVYEYATGMILRQDQVAILDWIFASLNDPSLTHLLFQFQAGGGKTKVLMPIIANKLSQRGAFPILINYTPFYEIGKRDLDKSLSAAFNQRVEVMEIDLGTVMTTESLQKILSSLQKYHQDRKCLAVKSESIYALLIARKAAFENESDMVVAINALLNFFKSGHSIALIDEAHLTLEALQETNQAAGKPEQLPLEHQQIMIELISRVAGRGDPLFIDSPSGRMPIQDKVRLLQNQQALLTDQDLEVVRNALIDDAFKRHPFASLDAASRGILLRYMQDPRAPSPPLLVAMHRSTIAEERRQASTIVLAKKYFYQLMPHTLHLIQGINYGDSIHPGDFTCAPRHDKKPITSKFQDVLVTAALTIQNALQSGLSKVSMKKVLELLIEEHLRRKEMQDFSSQMTESQALFNGWWGADAPSLESINLNRAADVDACCKKIGRHPDLIEFFLRYVALPQIQIYSKKVSATPPDLLETFGRTISFTATPGMMELYPHQLQRSEAVKLDLGFEASVLEVLCRPENSAINLVDFRSLEGLFEEIYRQDPESFAQIASQIDSGGLIRSYHNQRWQKPFFDL
jgi:hypothetical protein